MSGRRIIDVEGVDGSPRLGIDRTYIYIYTRSVIDPLDRYIYLGHTENSLIICEQEEYIDIRRRINPKTIHKYTKLSCTMYSDNPHDFIPPSLLRKGSIVIIE